MPIVSEANADHLSTATPTAPERADGFRQGQQDLQKNDRNFRARINDLAGTQYPHTGWSFSVHKSGF